MYCKYLLIPTLNFIAAIDIEYEFVKLISGSYINKMTSQDWMDRLNRCKARLN
jgi:hypothetical protein